MARRAYIVRRLMVVAMQRGDSRMRRSQGASVDDDAANRLMRDDEVARRAGELAVDRQWLAQVREEPKLPEQAIIDPHHHLWLQDPIRYTWEDYLMDAGGGHTLEATVYAECYSEYLSSGPAHLRPMGEVQFALEQSSQARSAHAAVNLCSAIIGHVDLGPPEVVHEAIEALVEVGQGRLRAVRPELFSVKETQSGSTSVFRDERWNQWVDTMQSHDLLLEAWVSYLQLPELAQLARRYPDLGIVLNHLGSPVGAGDVERDTRDMRKAWLDGIGTLSECQNVVVKIGGLGTSVVGFRFWSEAQPPTSTALTLMWRPWIEPVIDLFGPSRCMFESNYPVDARVGSFNVLWNCFKTLCEPHSTEDREALCRRTAAQTYRLAS
jgi:predicted TIM-barrel fold metal-dependent hydrolase